MRPRQVNMTELEEPDEDGNNDNLWSDEDF
jgi:hypothetical protein